MIIHIKKCYLCYYIGPYNLKQEKMKRDVIETKTVGKFRFDIECDNDPESPRIFFENLGTMVCFHRKYNLGDKHSYHKENYGGWEELRRDIIKREDVCVILPLYIYDHSGITMNTTGFDCKWDSSPVGFIFVSKKKIRDEFGKKRISSVLRKKMVKYLIDEVGIYDSYLTGDVYGVCITNTKTNEMVESYYGFYGLDSCREEVNERVKDYR